MVAWLGRSTLPVRGLIHRAVPTPGPRALLVAPAFLLLGVVVIIPLVVGLWLSVHDWRLTTIAQGAPFIGLENYAEAVGNPSFWASIRTTLVFWAVALAVEFILGLGLAVLLDHDLRGGRIARVLILLPMVATGVIVGLVWRMMMSYDFGVLNWLLSLVGIGKANWLGDADVALWSIVIADVWNSTPFIALILLAGLQAVPRELHQAASVDGATATQEFRYVTLPFLRPMILVAVMWRTIDLLRVYDLVYATTGGGPNRATEVISVFTYRTGFFTFNLGLASAMSYLLIVVIVVIVAVEVRVLGRRDR